MYLFKHHRFVFLLLFLFAGRSAWAVESYDIPNPLGFTDIPTFLCRIAEGIFAIALAASVIAFLLAAYFYLTSGGNEKKVTRAKEAINYVLYGAIVVFLAWGSAFIVASVLGGTGEGFAGCP